MSKPKIVYEAYVFTQSSDNRCKKIACGYYTSKELAEQEINSKFKGNFIINLKKIDYNKVSLRKQKNIDEHLIYATK